MANPTKYGGLYYYNPDTKQFTSSVHPIKNLNQKALYDYYIRNKGGNSNGFLTQLIDGKKYVVDRKTEKAYYRNADGVWEDVGYYDAGLNRISGGGFYDPDLDEGDNLTKSLNEYRDAFNLRYGSKKNPDKVTTDEQEGDKTSTGGTGGTRGTGGGQSSPLTFAQRYQNKIAWNQRNGLGTLATDYGFQLSNNADLDKLAALQGAIGVKVDGYWGPKSQAAWNNLTPEQKKSALERANISSTLVKKNQDVNTDKEVKPGTETEKQIQPPARVYHSADQYGSGNFDKNFYNTTIRGKRGVGSVDDLQYYMTVGGPGFKGENTHLSQITRQRLIDEGADPSILDDPTKFAEYARKNWGIKGKMGIFDRKRFIKGTNQYLKQKSIDEYRRSKGYTDGMYYGPGSKGYQAVPVNTGINTTVDQMGTGAGQANISGNVAGNVAGNSVISANSKFDPNMFKSNAPTLDYNQVITDAANKVRTEQQGGSMQFNPFVSVCRKKLQKPVKAAKGAKLSKDDKATITEAFLQYLQEYKNIDPSTLDPESQKFQDLFDEFITYKQDQLEAQKVAMDRFGAKLNYIKKLSKYRLGGALFMQEGGEMQQPMPQQMPPQQMPQQQMAPQGPEQPAGPRKLTTEELKQLTDDQIMGRAPIEIGGVVGYLNGDGEWIPQDMLTQSAAFGAKLKHIKRLNEFKCGGKSMKKGGKSKC